MAYFNSHRWHALALIAGLGLWTLAPYGGCSCRNPMGGSSPVGIPQVYGGLEAEQALETGRPIPANLVDDFNDGADSKSPTGHWDNLTINKILTQVWFNGNDPAYRVNFWGGGTYSQADAFGSLYYSKLDSPGAANVPGAPSTGQSASLQYGCPSCEYGRTSNPSSCAAGQDCGQIYPFIEHGMFLSPQGAGGDADVEFESVAGVEEDAPGSANPGTNPLGNHGLEFYLAPGYSNQLMVKLIPLYLYNYSNSAPCAADGYEYYAYPVPTADSGEVTIPFSDFELGAPYPATGPGVAKVQGTTHEYYLDATTGGQYTATVDAYGNHVSSLRIMAIQFDPNQTGGGGACSTSQNEFMQLNYNFSIDNVEFY